MKNDVLPRQQRVLDGLYRLVQLALPKGLRTRVHPQVLHLASRRTRWVIETLSGVCALHNDPNIAPVL